MLWPLYPSRKRSQYAGSGEGRCPFRCSKWNPCRPAPYPVSLFTKILALVPYETGAAVGLEKCLAGAGTCSLYHRVPTGPGAHPDSYSMCTLELKRPVSEADHSPTSNADVNNSRSYTSTLQYAFMAWCLVKHRDFILALLPLRVLN